MSELSYSIACFMSELSIVSAIFMSEVLKLSCDASHGRSGWRAIRAVVVGHVAHRSGRPRKKCIKSVEFLAGSKLRESARDRRRLRCPPTYRIEGSLNHMLSSSHTLFQQLPTDSRRSPVTGQYFGFRRNFTKHFSKRRPQFF